MRWPIITKLNRVMWKNYVHMANAKKCEILKIQDGGGRHLGFTKMLITSAWIELFGWYLKCIYLGISEIVKFHQKCKILKIQDGSRPPSWIYQNANNFRVDWAFRLKFELHIPWHNRNWKISSEMRNFQNLRWRPATILDLPKFNFNFNFYSAHMSSNFSEPVNLHEALS